MQRLRDKRTVFFLRHFAQAIQNLLSAFLTVANGVHCQHMTFLDLQGGPKKNHRPYLNAVVFSKVAMLRKVVPLVIPHRMS
ncbi:hypothetical protein L596_011738 [Steinernema carpocapsae]|uniref:Uncharacterized protein n=1 Tax=Steinernema carpocapsae TaxID=34508 RepID=A0A4V6A4K5_STECR|nr:hypothetical protein L596_011738 [Steinernema carpocapsae]